MTAQERLRKTIELTSPEGNIFEALWNGSDRSNSKKLGRFNYPDVPGEFVQDLDVGGDQYPMTIYFDGPEHDEDSKLFYTSCKEKGRWQIQHPIHGGLELQLVSFTEKNQPVTSGNVTEFDLVFVEPSDAQPVQTTPELAGEIDNFSDFANIAGAEQFDAVALQNTQSQIGALKNAIGQVQAAWSNTLSTIAELNKDINAFVNAVNRGINDALTAALITPLALAGQIQALMQTPALITANIESKFDQFNKMKDEVFGINTNEPTTEFRNVAAVKELTLAACVVGVAQVTINSELNTRAQAIESAQFVNQYFNDIVNNLDADQELFIFNSITSQYFSQSMAFAEHLRIAGLSSQYLLQSAFDLSIEKRFILDRPRTPIEITISEYGDLGEDGESNFDLFIASNKLKGNEILSLPIGREVVIYV